MLTQDQVRDMIKGHEGYVDTVYADSVGVLTCGWGHALHEGSGIPKEVSILLFEIDFNNAKRYTERLCYEQKLILNAVRQAILTDMIFNLGYAGVKKFKRFIVAMQREAWEVAAAEMLDSKWHTQVGKRAEKLAEMMHTGVWI